MCVNTEVNSSEFYLIKMKNCSCNLFHKNMPLKPQHATALSACTKNTFACWSFASAYIIGFLFDLIVFYYSHNDFLQHVLLRCLYKWSICFIYFYELLNFGCSNRIVLLLQRFHSVFTRIYLKNDQMFDIKCRPSINNAIITLRWSYFLSHVFTTLLQTFLWRL